MKDYKIEAITMEGKNVVEVISAYSEQDASRMAGERGLFTKNIKEVSKKKQKVKQLKTKDLIIFTKQMSTMLTAGITTDKALNLVRQKTDDEKLRDLYGQVYENVQKGESVSASLGATGVFPVLLVNMVASGEVSGNIADIFMTMSKFYEKQADLDRKIKTAMIYPIILGILTVAITILLVVFVLPSITENFSPEQMPGLTKWLMGVSNLIVAKWYLFIAGILGLIHGIRYTLTNSKARLEFDRFILEVPVVGPLLRKIYSARAASTIASLSSNGASILVIVEETGKTVGNTYIEKLFEDIYVKVSTGSRLSDAMEVTGVFDPMLYAMLGVGEESGDVDTILASVSEYFDQEAEAAAQQLVSLLEPLFMIIMGVVVGVVVVAIMLPIITIGDTI